MDRRGFVAGLATLLAAPVSAGAQKWDRLHRVGVLVAGITPARLPETMFFEAFRQALSQLGYREGQNIVFEMRAAERQTELGALAQELVRFKADVIVAGGSAAARAAKAATPSIPIVGVAVGGDHVASGLAQNIARPGGNFTGFLYGDITVTKHLQILQAMLPGLAQVGLVWSPDNAVIKEFVGAWDVQARALGLSLRFLPATRVEELDAVFSTLTAEKIRAVLVVGDPVWFVESKRAAQVGLRHPVAAIWGHIEIVRAGGLIAYSPDIVDMFRQAGGYVKKLLDGAKPGDLPLHYPSRWMLAINLNTAKALGLTIPPSVLAQADQVIER